MNSQSALQQQYPLSPRKFWKKLIEKLTVFFILGIAVAAFVLVVMFTLSDASDPSSAILLKVILGLDIVGLLLVTIIYSWYVKVYIKRYFYDGEENFITIKKGVFAPTEIHVQWKKIQDVYVDQDILDRIMGLYDVHIASATATSGIEAHIDGVDYAASEGLKKFFLNKMSNTGPANNTNDQANIPQQEANNAKTIDLSEEISSKVYPLSTKWTLVSIISNAISSIYLPTFACLFLFSDSKGSSVLAFDWGSVILVWIVLYVLSFIVLVAGLLLWKGNYEFKFNKDNIYYKDGILSLSEKHMPYSSIQDVTVMQGIIYRLVGLAKVKIENASSQTIMTKNGAVSVSNGIIIDGLSIDDANKITNLLKTTVLGRNSSKYGL